MLMIKIAVCDDNLLCLNQTKQSIDKWAQEKNLPVTVFSFDNGDVLLDRYRIGKIDIVLMDIMMPILDGMETAREIRKNDSAVKIIFLTSSPEFAVESYDVKASGYLLKPIKYDKLCNVLNDCVQSLRKEPDNIAVRTVLGYQKIYLNNIECIEAQNKKVVFNLNDGSSREALDTISNYAETLTLEKGFFKCHRSYIVYMPNVDHFNSLEIKTKSGISVPIARGYSKTFKEAYFAYIFKKEGDENA